MYTALGHVTLKTGERVEAGVVVGPDLEWAERLERLLQHKGDPWNWQNSQTLRFELGIEAYFYVLHRDGVPLANISTFELAGVGHFGHVWTNPPDRQKVASSGLMELQMADFRSRQGKALLLHTGFDSVAYHMYRKFGFLGVEPKSGCMAWYASSELAFENAYFARGETEIQPLDWPHWPSSCPLFLNDYPGVIRCAPLKLIGRQVTETQFLYPLQDAQRRRSRGSKPRALALYNKQTTAVVGFAAWDWHPLWETACLVDVYCHPDYWDAAGDLFTSLPLPEAERIIAYNGADCEPKSEMLLAQGFKQTAILKDRVPGTYAKSSFVDVGVFERARVSKM